MTMTERRIKITYDEDADVLYVSFQPGEAAANGVENDGFVRRYGMDQQLVGVTVLDFAARLRAGAIVGDGESLHEKEGSK